MSANMLAAPATERKAPRAPSTPAKVVPPRRAGPPPLRALRGVPLTQERLAVAAGAQRAQPKAPREDEEREWRALLAKANAEEEEREWRAQLAKARALEAAREDAEWRALRERSTSRTPRAETHARSGSRAGGSSAAAASRPRVVYWP